MKALTLTQPWASLVAIGAKTIETRSWKTDYRGPLAIHAAKTFGSVGGVYAAEALFYVNGIHDVIWKRLGIERVRDLPMGVVLCTIDLVDVDTTWEIGQRVSAQERIYGDYGPGRYAWVLDNPDNFLKPIPANGRLGLWDFEMPAAVS